jgi:chloramphenicol 3-O phosphotransferase
MMKLALLAAVIGLVFTACSFTGKKKNQPSPGKVIILNGPSGSGKSSIQREFQKLAMPNLWVKTGIDMLFDMPMPDITPENMEVWQSPNPIRWVESGKDEKGNPVITLKLGEQGERVAYAMNSAIAAYAKNGCNVIVDYIAYDQDWLNHLEEELSGISTYWVAVRISLETLEEREAARGTSPVGHARSHYHTVYGDRHYDIELSSEESSAAEIAGEIFEFTKR